MKWQQLDPDDRHDWFPPDDAEAFGELVPLGSKVAKGSKGPASCVLFKEYSLGISTNRDPVVYAFGSASLAEAVKHFAEHYSRELDRVRRKAVGKDQLDDFLDYSQVKWSRNLKRDLLLGTELDFDPSKLRSAAYRPFCQRDLYFADTAVDERGQFPRYFPTVTTSTENRVIAVTDKGSEKPFMAVIVSGIVDLHFVGAASGTQCFPFYAYDEDGTNRRENVSDWALNQFREHYKDKKIDKWAIFHYVYGLLHHPGYREKFADNLKRELPRIPFAPDFRAFAEAGKKLAALHLDYEQLEPWDLEFVEAPGVPLSYRVEDKMRLSKDKLRVTVNPSLTLARIPPAVLEYRLGNRSALEWVVDQ
ncbi:MAG: type ISP restriction/modification enzyme, partial [Pirellulales bacterium]